jgi:hypothetical protein
MHNSILAKPDMENKTPTICPVCGHSRVILQDSLNCGGGRKTRALQLINECGACQEHFSLRITQCSRTATLRTAHHSFECCISHLPISPGDQYYSITINGAGVSSLKYPDRVLPDFMGEYWTRCI